ATTAEAVRLFTTLPGPWRDRIVVPADQLAPLPAAAPGLRAPPRCRILEYRNQLVRIEASSPVAGYVVLADNDYPGWVATLAGRAPPILRADLVARAVRVAAGTHLVEFRYLPDSWQAGMLMSGAVLLLGLTAALRPATGRAA